MSPTNHALFLKAKQDLVMVVEPAPYTSPGSNEVVIRARAAAVNPCDYYVQQYGIMLEKYPVIIGCDVAGEVVEVGSGLKATYSVGDRIAAQADSTHLKMKDGNDYSALFKKLKDDEGNVIEEGVERADARLEGAVHAYAAFQEYVLVAAPSLCKIPKDMEYKDATVLGLGTNTASSCLFTASCLGLSPPQTDGSKPGQGKTLLVWGASSSVGSCGVQLASQAGYEVVGVASKRNHGLLQKCGAVEFFDHNDADVVDKVAKYLEGKDVVGAYDAISTDDTLPKLIEILGRVTGNKMIAAVMPGVEAKATSDVKIVTNFAAVAEAAGLGKKVWTWMEHALADGRMKCLPPPEVVGHGLEAGQKGCDVLSKGVSGKKIVFTL